MTISKKGYGRGITIYLAALCCLTLVSCSGQSDRELSRLSPSEQQYRGMTGKWMKADAGREGADTLQLWEDGRYLLQTRSVADTGRWKITGTRHLSLGDTQYSFFFKGRNLVLVGEQGDKYEFTGQNAEIAYLPPVAPDFKDPLFFIDGQVSAWVRVIFQDTKGNLWLGTNHYGVMRYNGDSLAYFSERDGLGGGRVNTILEDAAGNVWFATYGGLSKYDGRTFTNYPVQAGPVNNDLWSVIIDRDGLFWIGTLEGVVQFDGEEFKFFPIPKAAVSDTTSILSYNRIPRIIEDQKGQIWFGTDGFGICKYDGKSFTHFTKADGLCDNNVADLMEDEKGNIWIGTMYGGVSRYDGQSFTNFTRDGVIAGVEAYGFYEDEKGSIWFAAENYGVYRYDPSMEEAVPGEGSGLQSKAFTNFHTQDGLNTNGIISIYKDREGRFWFGGWGGLFRYNGRAFVSVTKDGPWEQ